MGKWTKYQDKYAELCRCPSIRCTCPVCNCKKVKGYTCPCQSVEKVEK